MQTELSGASGEAEPVQSRARKKRGENVSCEDVQKAIERIRSRGGDEDLRSILAEVGRGSLSTIHRHRKALGGNAPDPALPEVPVLSPHITKALAGELERLVKERTARLAVSLEDARASLDLVVEETEALQVASVESEALVDSTRASLAAQTGAAEALRFQANTLASQLDSSHAEAESARQQLALLRAQLSASEERRSDSESECVRLREHIEEGRRELQRTKEELEAERRACITLQVRMQAAEATEKNLKQSTERVHELQAELGDAKSRLSASDAERLSLVQRLDDARHALVTAESTVQKLLGKILDVSPAGIAFAKGPTSTKSSAGLRSEAETRPQTKE